MRRIYNKRKYLLLVLTFKTRGVVTMANHENLEKNLYDLCLTMLDLLQRAKDSGSINEETYLILANKKREFLKTHNPDKLNM